MFKKIALFLTVMLFAVTAAACGSTPAQPWDGTWKADGYVATVQNQAIEVRLVKADTDALYWKGTFKPASEKVSNEDVQSSADKAALKTSILGSQDDLKTFTSKDGKLTFNIQMMGVKKTVELTK